MGAYPRLSEKADRAASSPRGGPLESPVLMLHHETSRDAKSCVSYHVTKRSALETQDFASLHFYT